MREVLYNALVRYLSGPQMQRAYEVLEGHIPACKTCGERQFLENAIIDYSDGSATISVSCMEDHGRTMILIAKKNVEYVGEADSLDPLQE